MLGQPVVEVESGTLEKVCPIKTVVPAADDEGVRVFVLVFVDVGDLVFVFVGVFDLVGVFVAVLVGVRVFVFVLVLVLVGVFVLVGV